MEYRLKLVSSLEKIFFDMPETPDCTCGSMLKNEIHGFQLAAWVRGNQKQNIPCRLVIESELAPYITVYRVGYVPSLVPTIQTGADEDYLTKTPGLFPDPLFPIRGDRIMLSSYQARAFWFSVEPKGQITGSFPIAIKIYDKKDELVGQLQYLLEIIDAQLPPLSICNTGWFHGDCIAALHHARLMSDGYFEILEKFIAVYGKFGHNMILTPVFTPPLDTAVGGERPTNQLVGVTVTDGKYTFDFTLLGRWVDICRKHGIVYYEISHLFTQWGAQNAPKIMATVDGEYKKIFGWETDALSAEYQGFLRAFLPELTQFLRQEGILEQTYFHVSDEPKEKHEAQYKAAKALLTQYVDEMHLIDALEDYSFCEKGIVKTPVVCNDHIHTFMEHGAQNLWTYYCMSQRKDVANRFMAMPSYRNRVLGCQLYKNHIKGFLQWGFNFWFSEGSARVIDPYRETDAGGAFPSGDPFIVYPLGENGEVVTSLRLHVFCDALQDMRALELLESLTSREETEQLLREIQGFTEYPRNSGFYLTLRETVNQKIKAALS